MIIEASRFCPEECRGTDRCPTRCETMHTAIAEAAQAAYRDLDSYLGGPMDPKGANNWLGMCYEAMEDVVADLFAETTLGG